MDIFHTSSKFDCQISSYKPDTEFELLCFIVAISFSHGDNIIYELYIASIYLVCHKSYCQRNASIILHFL